MVCELNGMLKQEKKLQSRIVGTLFQSENHWALNSSPLKLLDECVCFVL